MPFLNERDSVREFPRRACVKTRGPPFPSRGMTHVGTRNEPINMGRKRTTMRREQLELQGDRGCRPAFHFVRRRTLHFTIALPQ